MPRSVILPPDTPPSPQGIKPGGWWHAADDGRRVTCDLCPRACSLGEGDRGFCFVRQNLGGRMVSTTYGRSTGFCIDPIEKKPLNQFYPGTRGALVRHGRLQPGVQVLPELGDFQVAARSMRSPNWPIRRRSPGPPRSWAAAAWPSPTTIR